MADEQTVSNYRIAQAKGLTPQKSRTAYGLAFRTNIPLRLAEELPQAALEAQDLEGLRKFTAESPRLAEFFGQSPVHAANIPDASESMKSIEKLSSVLDAGLVNKKQTLLEAQLAEVKAGSLAEEQRDVFAKNKSSVDAVEEALAFSDEYVHGVNLVKYRQMLGIATPSELAYADYQKQRWEGREDPIGFLPSTLAAGAEFAVSMYHGFKHAIPFAAGSAAGGAALGLAGGPFSEISVPVAAANAARVGFGVGIFDYTSQIEAGAIWDELGSVVDEDGNHIDETVRVQAALAHGLIAGSLETVGELAMAKLLPGFNKLTTTQLRGLVRKVLSRKRVLASVGGLIKKGGGAALTETTTEVAQDVSQILLREIAETESPDFGNAADPQTPASIVAQLKDTAEKTLKGAGLLSFVGISLHTHGAIGEARASQTLKSVSERGADIIKDSPIKESPEMMSAALQSIGVDAEVTASGKSLRDFIKNNPESLDDLEKIGLDRDQIEYMDRYGLSYNFGMADAMAKMSQDNFNALMDYSAPKDSRFTMGDDQGEKLLDMLDERIDSFSDAIGDFSEYKTALSKVKADIKKAAGASKELNRQILASGTTVDDYANTNVEIIDSVVRRLAAEGRDAKDVLSKIFVSAEDLKAITEKDVGAPTGKIGPDFTALKEVLDEKAPRGSYAMIDSNHVVKLFDNANLTTLSHEAGHVFLEELNMLAGSSGLSEKASKDWTSIKRHIGREQADGERITKTQAEIFARSWEGYFLTGKAPSLRLGRAFSRMNSWMSTIYGDIRGLERDAGFEININDDVRGAFDRLLAFESEIEEAVLDTSMNLLTQNEAENSGMPKDVFDDINEQLKIAERDGKSKALAEREGQLPSLQKFWRKEGEDEASENPVYRAIDYIRENGGLLRDEIYPDLSEREVSLRLSDEMIEGIKKHRPHIISRKRGEGVSAEIAASEFGYESADALLFDLAAIPSKQTFIKNHVELRSQEFIKSLPVDELIIDTVAHQNAMDKLALFLRKRTKSPGKIKTANYRYVAERQMQDMPIASYGENGRIRGGVIDTRRFMTEYRRAAAEERNTLAGALRRNRPLTLEQRVKTLRSALDSHEKAMIAKERVRISRETKARIANLRRFIRGVEKSESTKRNRVAYHWRENFKDLSNRFRVFGKDRIYRVANDKADMEDLVGAKNPIVQSGIEFNRKFTTEGYEKDFRSLSLDEFNGLFGLFQYLAGQGRHAFASEIASGRIRVANLQDQISDRLDLVKDAVELSEDNVLSGMYKHWREFDSRRQMLLFAIRMVDGFSNVGPNGIAGPAESYLYDQIEDGFTTSYGLKQSVVDAMKPHLKHLSDRQNSLPVAIDTGVPFPDKANIPGAKTWDFERILMVALHMGNPYELSSMARGFGWGRWEEVTDPYSGKTRDTFMPDLGVVHQVVSTLDDADWDAVQGIWDAINILWEPGKAVYKRVNGVDPTKVDAVPIVVTTASGNEKTLRGGYAPLALDRVSTGGEAALLDSAEDNIVAGRMMTVPNRGTYDKMFSTRTSTGGRAVLLKFSTILRHVEVMTRYIGYTEVYRDFERVFARKQRAEDPDGLAEKIIRKLGENQYNEILRAMRDTARPPIEELHGIDRFGRTLRSLSVNYILGLNLTVGIKQASSLLQSFTDIGVTPTVHSLLRFIANPIRMTEEAKRLSPSMRTRSESIDKDVSVRADKVFTRSRIVRLSRKLNLPEGMVRRVMFSFIRFFDNVATTTTWWAARHKAAIEADKSGRVLSEKELTREADKAVKATQPTSRDLFDQSAMQRQSKGLEFMFTMFSSFTLLLGNRNSFHLLAALKSKDVTSDQLSTLVRQVLYERLLAPLLISGLTQTIRGEQPDDDDWKRYGVAVLAYQFVGLPLFRELATSAAFVASKGKEGFPVTISSSPVLAGLDLINNVVIKTMSASDDENKRKRAIKAWADLISFASGVPVSRVYRRLKRDTEKTR